MERFPGGLLSFRTLGGVCSRRIILLAPSVPSGVGRLQVARLGAEAADAQQHYFCCPLPRTWGHQWLALPPLSEGPNATADLIHTLGRGGSDAMRVAV